MEVTVKKPWLKIAVLLSFLLMVTVNALANILPINGKQTGAISDQYQNLFTPAPITFAIWGAIYLALLVYVIYQLIPSKVDTSPDRQHMLAQVGQMFVLSSLLNTGWIFAWHYEQIALSMVLMVLILLSLMRAVWLLRAPHCNPREELALRLPFGLYFGWITVATIANAVVLLRSIQWDGFGISDPIWTVIILVVGAAILSVTMYRIRNAAYGLAGLWAYVGILIRHVSPSLYAGQYPLIVGFTIAMLVVLLVAWVVSARHMRQVAACDVPNA